MTNDASGNEISVLLRGRRLEITADVDADGLKKLRAMLDSFAHILAIAGMLGVAAEHPDTGRELPPDNAFVYRSNL